MDNRVATMSRTGRIFVTVLIAIALANALAVAFALPRSGPLVTTYAQSSGAAAALDLTAGLALLAAGIVAWYERAAGSLGGLALCLSVVWFAPDWVGWETGRPIARSVAMAVAPLGLALLLHVALAAPRGRVVGARASGTLALAYSVAAIVSVGSALLRDPFEDPYCWSNCSDNSFLVHADRAIAHGLTTLWHVAALAAGVLVVAVALWRGWRSSLPARLAGWPVLVPLAVAGAAEAVYAAVLLRTPLEDPDRTGFALIFGARSISFTFLACGIAWTAVRARRTRAVLAHAAVVPARPLREVLAAALGDPKLQVAYLHPGSGALVDRAGAPADIGVAANGRAITRIERRGDPVAVVAHDASLLDGPDLEREIGAAARLAVDNERLQASVLAHLADLRASRTRIIETGDAARARLERDLHDGVQQRLLALSYELRLALAAARDDGEGPLAELLAAAGTDTQLALEELRELARGIHPAILTEAGLEPALQSYADTAAIPVELGQSAPGRYPAGIETAAYLVVLGAVDDAARRGATHAKVSVVRHGGELVVQVADDGSGDRVPADHLVDRVGALGGRIEVEGKRLEAQIPCA